VDGHGLSSNTICDYGSTVEQDSDWSVRMTAGIGKRIAVHRERRKLTVQAVADRCVDLGLPIGRVTITKLEGGKRQAITPAELAVLAAALETAPIDLLYPIGYEKDIEVLPGMRIDPDHAHRWFGGELKLNVRPGVLTLREPQSGEESDTYLVEHHDALVSQLAARQAEVDQATADAAANPDRRDLVDYVRERHEEWRADRFAEMRRIRTQMRERGMILPEAPAGSDDDTGESYVRTAEAT
jgi:transcriptional regulator with XRE-family HTH domain